MSRTMLNNVKEEMSSYGSGYANYANLMLKLIHPYYEVAVVGKDAHEKCLKINKEYKPNKLFIGSFKKSNIPLLEGKFIEGQTMIYVCENKVCQMPTNKIIQALRLMK